MPLRFAEKPSPTSRRRTLDAMPWCGGDALAVRHGGACLTYRQLNAAVLERADRLCDQGVRPGQLIMARDSAGPDLIILLHSARHLDCALFPVNAGLSTADLQSLAAQTAAEWIWDGDAAAVVPTGHADSPTLASGIGLLIKTSGTTGEPKVAMLTTAGLAASARAAGARLGLRDGDRWLACLRLSHIGGIAIAYRCALAGAGMLLHEGFEAEAVAAVLRDQAPTHISLVPPMLSRLLDIGLEPPACLRVALIGGQALSRGLAQRALDAGWPLYMSYGMTETGSMIAAERLVSAADHCAGAVGSVLDVVEIDAGVCDAPPRRLRIRGAAIMAGYASPSRGLGLGIQGGWLETADLACSDTAGRLRILGRADDVLVIGGINVSRAGVEDAVGSAPGVRECAVLGMDDAVWGYRLGVAYAGEACESEVAHWCRLNLPSAERPRTFLRLRALPLLSSGKHDRQALLRALRAQGSVGEDALSRS